MSTKIMALNNWLSCEEASAIIGCTPDHVRLLARQKKVKSEKFGPRMWVIDEKSAREFAEKPVATGRPRKNID